MGVGKTALACRLAKALDLSPILESIESPFLVGRGVVSDGELRLYNRLYRPVVQGLSSLECSGSTRVLVHLHGLFEVAAHLEPLLPKLKATRVGRWLRSARR